MIKEIKRFQTRKKGLFQGNKHSKVMNGLGLAILSTPKGVMSDIDARKNNVGGEIIVGYFNV